MRRLAIAALAAASAVVSPVGASAPLRYVAMGDSYAAASGVLPPDPSAPFNCMRSTRNFANVIADATGAALTDVTCGAAETGHYFAPQYGNVPPQLDALSADTELVTMTIGGNDSGVFINAITSCGQAAVAAAFQGSPCKDRYGTSFEDTINTTTYPSLVDALAAVRDRAPAADVAVLGYPWILPESVGCIDKLPVAEGDVPYLRGVQATLNDAVRRAALATGVTYVDLSVVSDGHDACQPIGVRWVEPVLQSTNPVVVHPNALGEAEMAAEAMRVLGL